MEVHSFLFYSITKVVKKMPRRDIRSIIERTTGVARGRTQSARDVSMRLGQRLGRGSYVYYNLNTDDLSRQRRADIIESLTGRRATNREVSRFRYSRINSADSRERSRPTDAVSGERLSIYRNMRAYQITFS